MRYCGGHEAPLEPRAGQGTMGNLGYSLVCQAFAVAKTIVCMLTLIPNAHLLRSAMGSGSLAQQHSLGDSWLDHFVQDEVS